MVEVVKPNEKVRELTEAPRIIPVGIEGSVVYEVLLTLWTTFNPFDGNKSGYLTGKFHDQVEEAVSADLAEEIRLLGGPFNVTWLSVGGLFETAPHPHDPESLYEWLANVPATRFRRWLLGYLVGVGSAPQIELAANGDREALDELRKEHGEGKLEGEAGEAMHALFDIGDDLPRRIADVIKRFHSEVFDNLGIDFEGPVARAAAARRSVANGDSAKAIIEEVTQGLDYEIPLGVARVVLVPSIVLKPLSVIDHVREALIVYYGMADEFIDSDPEAPPSWLVNTYKALSDEKRLRILRRISEGDTSLDDLTELLGLSKSTVHHHISLLRSAGLIRVTVPTGKEKKKAPRIYSLRAGALNDATGFLNAYLRDPELEVEHA